MMKRSAVLLALLVSGAPLAAAPVDPALYSSLHWRQLGPFRAGWAEMIEGVPSRPDTYYFAASGGGVWKTDDSGRTWASLFDRGGSSAIGAIAVAPSRPDTIYIGGGQPEPRYDVQAGRGVYRSTDGGRSWSDLGLADTKYIGKIWVSPTDPDTLLVAAVGHFFGPSEARGIYRSTDGGKSWAHTLMPGAWTGAVDLASDPAHPRTIFAAAWEARQYPWQSYFTPTAGPGSAIYRSDDGGIHWRRLEGGGWPTRPLGRISLATARKGGALRLYAVVDAKADGGMWRSDDGGAHWTHVNKEQAFASYYASRIAADPHDPDVVYTVGQSIRRCDHGGATCTITRGSPGGDDYHHLWFDPAHPERMAAASDQGAAISVNGGKTWSDWYNQPTGQLYHLAADNRFPYWIYSGQQDSGTVGIASRSDYGAPNFRNWTAVGGDERDYDIPDPNDPNIVYGSGLGGHATRWDARTGQVTDISPYPVSSYGKRPTVVRHHFNWVTPLVASRSGPPALYMGGEIVWRSLDQGRSWAEISPDLTGKAPGAVRCGGDVAIADAMTCGYGTITALEPSPLSPASVWVGSDTGLIHVTGDGGAHWARLAAPVREWSKISSIDLSAVDAGTAYVAVDGQRLDDFAPHVLRTHDGGRNWTEAVRGLPPGEVVSSVRADPVRRGLLYAGTETGVWVSFDDGDDWQPLKQNLPTAWARDLLVHGDDLIVATQGRAIWVLGDLALLRQVGPEALRQPVALFTPATAIRVRDDNNKDTPLPPETAVGENPPEGAVIDYRLGAARGPVTLDIRDSAGALVRHYSSSERPQRPDAERYFAAGWARPAGAIDASPGQHRWVWDLRRERPRAVEYNYSIAAIWGKDTPILPQGALVPPGRYTAVLTAGGVERRANIDVVADPRVIGADYAASAAFSRSLEQPMAKAWQGAAESGALLGALKTLAPNPAANAVATEAKALAGKATPPEEPGAGFAAESGILAGLEAAAEGSDSPPSAAMVRVRDEVSARVDRDYAVWQQVRNSDLAAFNRRLIKAGIKPITIPPPDALNVIAPDGGQDLP